MHQIQRRMRKFAAVALLTIGLGLILAGSASSRGKADASRSSPANGLNFPEPTVSLGRHTALGTITQRFSFQATGERPVEIVELRPSCGCLKPVLSKRKYLPGEGGEIDLVIHATSQKPGPRRFELAVTYRDPIERTTTLRLEIEFTQEVIVEPSNIFVYLNGRKDIRQQLSIKDQRPRRLEILDVKSSSNLIRPLKERPEAADSSIQAVSFEVSGAFPEGTFDEKLVVTTTDPIYKELEIPITVVRPSQIRAFPPTLSIPARRGGDESVVRYFMLRDTEGRSFKIVNVTSDESSLSFDWPKSNDFRPKISVTAATNPAESDAPARQAFVRVELEAPVKIQIIVPVKFN